MAKGTVRRAVIVGTAGAVAVAAAGGWAFAGQHSLAASSFAAALVNPATHLRAGVAPLLRPGQTSSTPSGAHLTYHDGKVISNVAVVEVLYGGGTYETEVQNTASPSVATFYGGVTNSAYFDWLTEYDTTPYGSAGTNQTIGRGSLTTKQVQITPSSANDGSTIDDTNIQQELSAQIAAGSLPTPDGNTLFAVYFPHGKTITMNGATSGVNFCAYHGTVASSSTVPEFYYSVLPDFTTHGMATGCGSGSEFQNVTMISSHELVEATTDAEVGLATGFAKPLAWYDANNNMEIGDLCNQMAATVQGGDGVTYTVQKEWSNAHNACIAVPPQNASGITNGGFETGTFAGWTTSGVTAIVNSGAQAGTYAARVGSPVHSGSSSIAQKFTPGSGAASLTVWYDSVCPDTVKVSWAAAKLADNTAKTTTTVLAKTCSPSVGWLSVSTAVVAGHHYTLTLSNHDDNDSADGAYTLFDSVALTSSHSSAVMRAF